MTDTLSELLYDNYAYVYKYLVKFTFSRDLAGDLTQETMVKAIEKYHLYDPSKAAFPTWLVAIARNAWFDWLRTHQRERPSTDVVSGVAAAADISSLGEDAAQSGLPSGTPTGSRHEVQAGNRTAVSSGAPATNRTGDPSDVISDMLEALGHLAAEVRTPVILKHYYGYTYEEIAAMMSIPAGTVKSRIHHGLELLRKELESDE